MLFAILGLFKRVKPIEINVVIRTRNKSMLIQIWQRDSIFEINNIGWLMGRSWKLFEASLEQKLNWLFKSIVWNQKTEILGNTSGQ